MCAFCEQEGHLAALYPLRYFIFKGSLVDPRLRAPNEINAPSKLARSLSGMRADGSSTARVQRGLSVSFSHHHNFSLKGVAGLSFTARIGRAPFHRARSASKKDGSAAPYPFPIFATSEK